MAPAEEYMRFFPYESPYKNQREAMERIHNALTRGQDVLFEGACGTGKTISALLPALEHARNTGKTVVITTNVHQQMRQFVRDARAITETEPLRAVVFRGKSSMCHIDVGYEECQVLRDNTRDIIDLQADIAELESRERELLTAAQSGDESAIADRDAIVSQLDSLEVELGELTDRPTCDYYHENLTAPTGEFYDWLFADVRRPDDIYDYAESAGFCGYELLKKGMEDIDLAVCNYHHLLHPDIRSQFFRWLDCEPSDVITIFDEAHNIESAARDSASRTLAEQSIDGALDELLAVDDPRASVARDVFSAFRQALVETYRDRVRTGDPPRVAGNPIGTNWTDVPIQEDTGPDSLTQQWNRTYRGEDIEAALDEALALGATLDEQYEEAYRNGETQTRTECPTLHSASFLLDWLHDGQDPSYYPVIGVRLDERSDSVVGRAELYPCIPREIAGSLFSEVYASVLMSATLRPFPVIRDVLGISDPVEMAYGLTFPEERRRTFVVDGPPLFARNRNDPEVQNTITQVLTDAIRLTPGNTLLYFPSYGEAARYHDRLHHLDATRYRDKPGTRAEELRQEFTSDDNGALFTSIWGTLSEGVSFDGDDARTVVVVGVPYPYLDERMEAVKDAYAAEFRRTDPEAGWRYAVEIPTIRKTRQALGRVLRSPDDFGVRILLDQRYTLDSTVDMARFSVRNSFPQEEREELIDVHPDRLRYAMLNFYGDLNAYAGDPPAPDG